MICRRLKAALTGTALAFLAVMLSGCATPNRPGGSRQSVLEWSRQHGFVEVALPAGRFKLLSLVRRGAGEQASIYVEGDGASWTTAFHPPRNPTPANPVSLTLAAADPASTVAYLGRPCQYLDTAAAQECGSDYWTARRFAPEVIDAYDEAINELKRLTGASRIRLYGYSGGGVIAALLASRRRDVAALVTVASPLALNEWTAWHDVSPLPAASDPAEADESVTLPPGVHFVGGNDKTVPSAIVERFVRRKGGRLEVIPGFDHECCWARDWAVLLKRTTVRENSN